MKYIFYSFDLGRHGQKSGIVAGSPRDEEISYK
jgi:hypothetical protein